MDIEIKWPTTVYIGCILPLVLVFAEIVSCYKRGEMTDVVAYSAIIVIAMFYNIWLIKTSPFIVSGETIVMRKPPLFQEVKFNRSIIDSIKYDKKKVYFHLIGGSIIDIERRILAKKGVDAIQQAFPNHQLADIQHDV